MWQAAHGQSYLADTTSPCAARFASALLKRAVLLEPYFSRAHAGLSESLWRCHLFSGPTVDLKIAERHATIAQCTANSVEPSSSSSA